MPYFRCFTGDVIHGLLLAIIKYMASSLLPVAAIGHIGLLLEYTNTTVHALKIVNSNTVYILYMSLMCYKLIAIFCI